MADPVVPISTTVPARFRRLQFARNGLATSPIAMANMIAATNHILKHRRKSLFSSMVTSPQAADGSSSTTYARQRFYFLTGVSATHVRIRCYLAPRDSSISPFTSRVRLDLTKVGGSTTTAYMDVTPVIQAADSYNVMMDQSIAIACDAKSEYTLEVTDEGTRLVAIEGHDECQGVPVDAIAIDELSIGGAITTTPRESLKNLINDLYQYHQSTLFTWAFDTRKGSSTWPKTSSGTVSKILPAGVEPFIDLTNVARRSKSTVPCKFVAYCDADGGTPTGEVYLRDGTTVKATLSINSTTAQWYTTTCDLDPSGISYNLAFKVLSASTVYCVAAGLFIYDP